MTDRNDGGPAFPLSVSVGPAGDVYSSADADSSMSLRDWFAGQALVGMLAADPHLVKQGIAAGSFPGASHPRDFANCAYRMADAMLEERKR